MGVDVSPAVVVTVGVLVNVVVFVAVNVGVLVNVGVFVAVNVGVVVNVGVGVALGTYKVDRVMTQLTISIINILGSFGLLKDASNTQYVPSSIKH